MAHGRDLEASALDAGTPESNVEKIVGSDVNPRLKYLVVKYYLDKRDAPKALRAAIRLVELLPDDSKANALLGYVYVFSGDFKTATPILRKALDLGDAESVIPLSICYFVVDGDDMTRVLPLISLLEEMKSKNIEAYQPLVLYAGKLKMEDREAFSKKIFNGVDLRILASNKSVASVSIHFFQDMGDYGSANVIIQALRN